jgi:hypothetical protein
MLFESAGNAPARNQTVGKPEIDRQLSVDGLPNVASSLEMKRYRAVPQPPVGFIILARGISGKEALIRTCNTAEEAQALIN